MGWNTLVLGLSHRMAIEHFNCIEYFVFKTTMLNNSRVFVWLKYLTKTKCVTYKKVFHSSKTQLCLIERWKIHSMSSILTVNVLLFGQKTLSELWGWQQKAMYLSLIFLSSCLICVSTEVLCYCPLTQWWESLFKWQLWTSITETVAILGFQGKTRFWIHFIQLLAVLLEEKATFRLKCFSGSVSNRIVEINQSLKEYLF